MAIFKERIEKGGTTERGDLVGRIMAGDRQAEAELVENYSGAVMSIIRSKAGDAALASDLYQETFCIILEKIRGGDLRDANRLSGFVCAVARNRVIKYYQRATRQQSLSDSEEGAALPCAAADQLEQLLRKERAHLVRQILREMNNERDIQVLFKFYLAEDEKEQICAELGLTGQQFNLVLHRARARYRELYLRAIARI